MSQHFTDLMKQPEPNPRTKCNRHYNIPFRHHFKIWTWQGFCLMPTLQFPLKSNKIFQQVIFNKANKMLKGERKHEWGKGEKSNTLILGTAILLKLKITLDIFSALLSILTKYVLYRNCISSFLGISTYHILSYY